MAHLTEQEKEALALFKERLLAVFPGQVDHIKVFGSKARGEATKFSDVDVVVMLRQGGWQDSSPIRGIATDVFLETGVDLSVKVLTQDRAQRLRESGSPLLMNIDREGIIL